MRNYYPIGSQHGAGKGKWEPMFPSMLKASAVDVGYAPGLDLTNLYGKPESEIRTFLIDNDPDRRAANSHRLFLNLRPGDLVAVKKFVAPKGKVPRLVICAYAIVTERPSGEVYEYHKGHRLPHQISVDFRLIEDREFQIGGYGGTISRMKIAEHIETIFKPLFGKFPVADRMELKDRGQIEHREGVVGNLADHVYHVNKTIKATKEHNKLQQKLYNQLVSKYGAECVLVEKSIARGRIDLQVRTEDEITLYEVKPFDTAFVCLREALGQIMLYAWQQSLPAGVQMKLVIAGPCAMTKDERDFLNYLRKRFDKDLDYLAIV